MEYTIKLAVEFDDNTKAMLHGQSRVLNWLYNHLLEQANELREDYKKTQSKEVAQTVYTKYGLRNLLPAIKKQKVFLKSCHSSPLKNTALRLTRAIQDYQKSRKGKRAGKALSWPKFRSIKRGGFFSLLYDEPNKGFKISGRRLKLSLGVNDENKRLYAFGKLEKSINEFDNIEVRNLRLLQRDNQYYVCICVKKELPQTKEIKKFCSIDPNHKNLGFVVDSEGHSIEIQNPYFLKNIDKRIDSIKSKRDRCMRKSRKVVLDEGKVIYKPSKRWIYLDKALSKAYALRREQTKTYHYTIANKLYQENDLVSIGDYTPNGGGISKSMRRSMNNQSLIGRFKLVLSWVAQRGGKHYLEWSEHGTTRTCSTKSCQFVHKNLTPDIRSWVCPECKTTHIRDENAALNGLNKVINKTLPCFGHLDQTNIVSRCAWKFTGLGVDTLSRGSVA